MTKKKEITQQDLTLFRDAVRGTKQMTYTKTTVVPPVPKKTIKKPKTTPEDEIAPDIFSEYDTLPPLDRDDLMEYSVPGLQHKTLRNLRNGKYNIEATLDLHGQTVIEARLSLSQFLFHCYRAGKRHLLIIHGKGHGVNKPVLKNKLNHWLRETDLVLAFCSASIRDGRSGSLYILLKGRS